MIKNCLLFFFFSLAAQINFSWAMDCELIMIKLECTDLTMYVHQGTLSVFKAFPKDQNHIKINFKFTDIMQTLQVNNKHQLLAEKNPETIRNMFTIANGFKAPEELCSLLQNYITNNPDLFSSNSKKHKDRNHYK